MTSILKLRLLLTAPLLLPSLCARLVATEAPLRPAVLPHGEEMELIFHDEFDGNSLNTSVWRSSEYGEGFKRDTFRGPENLEVREGRLLLKVRKEEREHNGKTGTWSSGLISSRETVENNVYIEARFKPTAASGINNAFWLSCLSEKRTSFSNRYEVDVPETRKMDDAENTGQARLAWHDWKTSAYTKTAKGAVDHIAQAITIKHTWDAYHTWGLWLGENDMIYYLDGKEVWQGKTHPKYEQQWRTGVGKFDHWYRDEERRAYGNFGQQDWIYGGGYTGDRMNIVLSTLPWAATGSALTEAADGTAMEVDYVRVWKPKRLLSREASLAVDLAKPNAAAVLAGSTRVHESGALLMRAAASATLALPQERSANPYYFSLVVKKLGASALRLQFEDEAGKALFHAGVESNNVLLAGFSSPARTDSSYPAQESKQPLFTDGKEYLLVVRLTPGEKFTAISLSAFSLPLSSEKEPYFYRNIDLQGNTSVNNEWMVNQKNQRVGNPSRIVIKNEGEGDLLAGDFRAGLSYLSVLPSKQISK